MLTPALSALIVNRLTHERRSLFLRPKFKRNLSRYALSWFLPPLLAFAGAGLYFLIFPSQFQPLASRFAVNNGLAEPVRMGRQLLPVVLHCGSRQSLRRTDSGVGRGTGLAGLAASPAARCPGHAEIRRCNGFDLGLMACADHPAGLQLWNRSSAARRADAAVALFDSGDHPGLAAISKVNLCGPALCGMRP